MPNFVKKLDFDNSLIKGILDSWLIYNIKMPKMGSFSPTDYLGGNESWIDMMVINIVEMTGITYDILFKNYDLSELFKFNAMRLSKEYSDYMNKKNE